MLGLGRFSVSSIVLSTMTTAAKRGDKACTADPNPVANGSDVIEKSQECL
jgi:hypothetical protein